ncbi:transposase [Corallococcus sp. Z5C101001]|nr:transposase [Corallococcus sp. Z5C101001]
MGKSYPSDLTDAQWRLVEPLLEDLYRRVGQPPLHPRRRILDALLYVTRGVLGGYRRPRSHAARPSSECPGQGRHAVSAGRHVHGRRPTYAEALGGLGLRGPGQVLAGGEVRLGGGRRPSSQRWAAALGRPAS